MTAEQCMLILQQDTWDISPGGELGCQLHRASGDPQVTDLSSIFTWVSITHGY